MWIQNAVIGLGTIHAVAKPRMVNIRPKRSIFFRCLKSA